MLFISNLLQKLSVFLLQQSFEQKFHAMCLQIFQVFLHSIIQQLLTVLSTNFGNQFPLAKLPNPLQAKIISQLQQTHPASLIKSLRHHHPLGLQVVKEHLEDPHISELTIGKIDVQLIYMGIVLE